VATSLPSPPILGASGRFFPRGARSAFAALRASLPRWQEMLSHEARERRLSDPVQREADRLRSSGRWRRFRAWFLARNPLCAECGRAGRVEAACEVDHVTPLRTLIASGGGQEGFAVDACQSLCKHCHVKKSALERRGDVA
jgi:5-methylcytosine-specific restriction endonuclease McrA